MFPIQEKCGLRIIKDLVNDSSLSRVYGFILYTERDPFVVKVLRDDDYWNALDRLSGVNWPIFAVKPLKKGEYKVMGGSSGFSFLVRAWDEPQYNIPIIQEFGLKDSEKLPLFVVFMWDDDDQLHRLAIPIKGNDESSVYNSIKKIVKTVSDAEQRILPEYKRTEAVFNNVKADLEAVNIPHFVLRTIKITAELAGYLSMFFRQ